MHGNHRQSCYSFERSGPIGAGSAQDYDVTDIQCTFASGATGTRDSVTALLRKPEGFRGAPLFADDRSTDPIVDPFCQIRPELNDPTNLLYRLQITDFARCGVLKRNGFVHVRVWFPQFPGVVMQSDQELIIMCKPPEPTIIENKAAGFAGSFPHGARVSGVVEETPGRLEYEVALYKEAPPVSRHTNQSVDVPLDQAVPIGTKLQLRARINPDSAWQHIKLLEVAVSPDPDRPHATGAVLLVKDGCRNRDFASIIPHQPARYRERHNERSLPDSMRNVSSEGLSADNNSTPYTRFKENLEYTVVMPGDMFYRAPIVNSCMASTMLSTLLGFLLLMSTLCICAIIARYNSTMAKNRNLQSPSIKGFEMILRELAHHSMPESGYAGRPTVQ
ncbi:PREDICTED: uncharacterized protein LOC106109671 [Papilio polytes]|uniref:uncharacterized protein LOC106109671 n=1 Tax=Papilio polytes TaxID=76194 RepID=UPI000675FEB0|nr:PREDICTED: uncharacterized protein LOC106109671 [Papilio polytes]